MSTIRNSSVKKILSELQKISDGNPDLYEKFIKEYNRPLKEGLYSDYMNRDSLLELIRFKSSDRDGYVSLKMYKERMPEAQKSIYYIAGGREDVLKKSPLIEAYKKKGYEVLIMADDIDDIIISSVPTYSEIPLKAINKSGAIEEIKSADDKVKEEAKQGVKDKIKAALGDRVKDVIISSRLSDSPSAVVVDENDPTVQTQRLLKAMGAGDMPEVKPILEINPDSPIILKIESLKDDDKVRIYSEVLLDQALLQEGLMPQDPAQFAKNLSKLLSE